MDIIFAMFPGTQFPVASYEKLGFSSFLRVKIWTFVCSVYFGIHQLTSIKTE